MALLILLIRAPETCANKYKVSARQQHFGTRQTTTILLCYITDA